MVLPVRLRDNPFWEKPWRAMIAVNVAIMIGVFLFKITREPFVPYIHLLVDYHFGFTKRALIGAMVGVFFSRVPVWLVFALSGTVWLITLGMFIKLFRKTFGFDEAHLPLFVLMAGSPFFFKNFMFTLGHFDIYGCAFAIGLLLIPARSVAYVVLAAVASMILILIHHIHLLMYVPTIAVIVILRYYLAWGLTRSSALVGIAAAASVGALFFAAQFYGTMAVPQEEFVRYLQGRMADPAKAYLLTFPYIWYQSLSDEIRDTWARMPSNLLGVPVFAILIALHAPLWKYFSDLIRSLAQLNHRRIVVGAIILVSFGYLIIFATVFDYSRWISNWAVCMFLILHAVKGLPSSGVTAPVPNDQRTSVYGWIVTLIPRVGIVRPF
jgi:hypothetical protein